MPSLGTRRAPARPPRVELVEASATEALGRNRQRLDLVTDGDVEVEVERLVALGAARLRELPGGVELADVDGNEFGLAPA